MTEVFHWNPRRSRVPGALGRLLPFKRPVNNFGDLLGPLIVSALAARRGRDIDRPVGSWQLMSVGSVLHLSRPGAVVWGSGINGKMGDIAVPTHDLDVRAVRGPRTAARLAERGVKVPMVYGDPGLLVAGLRPELRSTGARAHRVAVVPNLNDPSTPPPSIERDVLVNPRAPLFEVLHTIANSELVVGSSLHGIVVAEAFGVPARMVVPAREDMFKYVDYYEATGRPGFTPASSVAQAIDEGGEAPLAWDPEPLLEAFPAELWAARA